MSTARAEKLPTLEEKLAYWKKRLKGEDVKQLALQTIWREKGQQCEWGYYLTLPDMFYVTGKLKLFRDDSEVWKELFGKSPARGLYHDRSNGHREWDEKDIWKCLSKICEAGDTTALTEFLNFAGEALTTASLGNSKVNPVINTSEHYNKAVDDSDKKYSPARCILEFFKRYPQAYENHLATKTACADRQNPGYNFKTALVAAIKEDTAETIFKVLKGDIPMLHYVVHEPTSMFSTKLWSKPKASSIEGVQVALLNKLKESPLHAITFAKTTKDELVTLLNKYETYDDLTNQLFDGDEDFKNTF